MHQFIYNGRSSADSGLILSGEDTWKKAVPELERTAIPGRNGDLLLSNRRYGNVSLTYHIGIQRAFPEKYSAVVIRVWPRYSCISGNSLTLRLLPSPRTTSPPS